MVTATIVGNECQFHENGSLSINPDSRVVSRGARGMGKTNQCPQLLHSQKELDLHPAPAAHQRCQDQQPANPYWEVQERLAAAEHTLPGLASRNLLHYSTKVKWGTEQGDKEQRSSSEQRITQCRPSVQQMLELWKP